MPSTPTIDDTLMATLASPDSAAKTRERAFRELVRRHAFVLASTVRCVVRDPGSVDDVVQDAFLRVYQARERYQTGGPPFRAWLLRIGRNLALDVQRKRARRDTGSLEDAPETAAPGPSPAAALMGRQRTLALRAAVERLKKDDREALLLRYEAELSYEEIAEILDTSPAAVKQRVFRARKRVRASLEEAES